MASRSDPRPIASLAELDAALREVAAGGDADPLWARVRAADGPPLSFGETAVFLHRAEAGRVSWPGDHSGWQETPEVTGRRVGASDLWVLRRAFHPAARLDYKLAVDGHWQLDPWNPRVQASGFGPNSELRMPGWRPPPALPAPPPAARGALGPEVLLGSRALGYPVRLRVHRPAAGPGPVAALYVTDGPEYADPEMGDLCGTLDALAAAGRIPPTAAVLVDHRDPHTGENRRFHELLPDDEGRSPFIDFVVEELVPWVEARLPVDPERRGILGTSLGGLFAATLAVGRPRLFPLAGIQSPAFGIRGRGGRPGLRLPGRIAAATALPRRAFVDVGAYEEILVDEARAVRDALSARRVALRHVEVPEGHSWGHWRATLPDLVGFLLPPG
jgi:enterochelin esterase family protein